MSSKIYMSSPDVGDLEQEYVLNAMRSGWIAPLGPDVDGFEQDIATRVGVQHAVALSSGTAALHLALLGLGVGAGDTVVTATMTFAATANAIAYTGAAPYFVDSDPVTGNISPALLEQALAQLVAEGRRVAAIVPVDLLGRSADYDEILPLAERYGIPVLADAAESLGASYRGKAAGSYGVAAALSFNGNKILTTSGGGMLLTDDEALASRARYLATQARQPVVHYEHVDIGYNYRMSNLLAALGRAQLSRLDAMIARRAAVRELYRELFAPVQGVSIFQGEGDESDNKWLTSILVEPSESGWTAEELREWLNADQIESRPLWKPMHLQPAFADAGALVDGSAQHLFEVGITLPSGSVLDQDQLDRVQGRIHSFLGAHS
ncbi:aminotransferase class I/II-fold pyridoxal phosphate-dependent enzyme [Leifsonia sp. PS1209]|uniref:DegT/DnrJ/EryC1/StrS family aminotransferase n=1 Tax=Leifsonia sp. PS1209 TaxID=2724914 RepID=UPI001B319895|nr:aminotransferase class I/II-fold pyridoxal phosphate-dependent enzyme [Leifsonia sp. PS1209]